MRSVRIAIALSLAIMLAGCRTQPTAPASPSVAELRAQFKALYAQYRKDCIDGNIAEIDTRKSLCEAERQRMDPVSNALQAAEQAETARQLGQR